ncbi:MAG: DUF1565 domain-containing protein [Bacteroidales bacterium]|nr:DUF1565 domain-containing protein [Bacteroidales bacterium]
MMKKLFLFAFCVCVIFSANAQFNNLKNAAKNAVKTETKKAVNEAADKAKNDMKNDSKNNAKPNSNNNSGKSSKSSSKGQTYYVSGTTGSNRNDGSKDAPLKNIQKALDIAEAGSTILVAEGNYYGLLNSGNIVITKPVSIIGGYSSDFKTRNVLKYKTMVQPTCASNGSASGNGTIQIKAVVAPGETVLIDGLIMDRGNSIAYNPKGEGQPKGVASARMQPIGTAGVGGADLKEECHTTETAMIFLAGDHGVINNVNVVVKNCAFINCPNYGVVGMLRGGSLTIDNCIFVNVRMATLDVRGADKSSIVPITFENNTVMFVWTRLKDLGDMGYGYRMIPGTSNTLRNNIFGCAVFAGIDRTHVDSDKNLEAKRVEVVENNIFFLNRYTDLTLPGGGKFLRVRVQDFDDVDQFATVAGNKPLSDPAIFNGKINAAYLEGFLSMESTTEVSVDYNSSANQFRSAFGMNLQGTGGTKATMFANRYPWEEALELFGAVKGCGAQAIK